MWRWLVLGSLGLGLVPGCVETTKVVFRASEHTMVLRVDCKPEVAEVLVDGVFQGSCGLLNPESGVLTFAAGTHLLEVVAAGYRPYRSELSAVGFEQRLTIQLQPLPEP